MAQGYLSGGVCSPSYQLAAQHFCASFPKTVSTGDTPVTYSCAVLGTSGQVIIASQIGANLGGFSQFTPYYASCDTDTFNAPTKIGADIQPALNSIFAVALLALAVIWGLRRLLEVFWPSRNENP